MFYTIFDMDGVLVDSSEIHFRAWAALGDEIGTPHTREFFNQTFGMHNAQILPLWLPTVSAIEGVRLADRKEEIYRALARESLHPLPGVIDLLTDLRAADVPMAVGSSGPRPNVKLILELLGIAEFFDFLSTGDDVKHGKPDPEVFLKAAAGLKAPPQRCIVIEDAPQGVEAARRAGMKVLAVTSSRPAAELAADQVVASLEEVRAQTLRSLVEDT